MNESTASVTRAAARTVRLSAVVSVVGLVFLAAMYIAFAIDAQPAALVFGWINDASAVVMCLLLVPSVIALHGLIDARDRVPSALVAASGMAGIAWVVALQTLLCLGVLTFEQEVGPVSVGFLALAAWFVAVGWLAGRAGILQRGAWMGLLGASYLGFPVWAIWLARRLDVVAGIRSMPRTVVTE